MESARNKLCKSFSVSIIVKLIRWIDHTLLRGRKALSIKTERLFITEPETRVPRWDSSANVIALQRYKQCIAKLSLQIVEHAHVSRCSDPIKDTSPAGILGITVDLYNVTHKVEQTLNDTRRNRLLLKNNIQPTQHAVTKLSCSGL